MSTFEAIPTFHLSPEDAERFDRAKREILERIEGTNIEAEVDKDYDDDDYICLHFPNGRRTRDLTTYWPQQLEELLAIPFEKYVFLGVYNAICRYDIGKIECGVFPLGIGTSAYSVTHRVLFGEIDTEDQKEASSLVFQDEEFPDRKIEISPVSTEYRALVRSSSPSSRLLSIKINGVDVQEHDRAVQILQRLSDSVFFHLDLSTGLAIGLSRERTPFQRRNRKQLTTQALSFPKYQYDSEPMSLYWYAKGASSLPLLTFLAFYQTIEYFFPVHSQGNATRIIRNMLRDPRFDPESDTDITRILDTLRSQLSRGYGDEKSQLKATVQACIEPDELKSFIDADSTRNKYFNKPELLSQFKINTDRPNADVVSETVERIYNIRCKIVHTKASGSDGDVELLLPFSKEAGLLPRDNDLVEFVAQKVLMSGGRRLHI